MATSEILELTQHEYDNYMSLYQQTQPYRHTSLSFKDFVLQRRQQQMFQAQSQLTEGIKIVP